MNPLQAELNRLYRAGAPKAIAADLTGADLIDAEGRVRALVLELARPADWSALAPVWHGVQADLDLPAPAIAVSGVDGHQLWFSLAEPVPAHQAMDFLEALRARYLGNMVSARISLFPAKEASAPYGIRLAPVVPAVQSVSGVWSAFIAPDLAAIFSDEPWLDLPPGADAQAKVLSTIASIKPADFHRALARLVPVAPPVAALGAAVAPSVAYEKYSEPRRFLLAVMNDSSVEMHLRIEAAKALLPHCEG